MAGIRRPQCSDNASHWLINFAAPVWIQDGPDLHRFLILQNAEEVGCIPWPLDLRHVVITREYVSDLQRSRVLNNYLMADNRHHKFSMNWRPPTRTRSVMTQRLREVHPLSLLFLRREVPPLAVMPCSPAKNVPLNTTSLVPMIASTQQGQPKKVNNLLPTRYRLALWPTLWRQCIQVENGGQIDQVYPQE